MKLKMMIAAIGATLCLAGGINEANAQHVRGGVSIQSPNASVSVRVNDPYYRNRGNYYNDYRDRGYRRGYRHHHRYYGHPYYHRYEGRYYYGKRHHVPNRHIGHRYNNRYHR